MKRLLLFLIPLVVSAEIPLGRDITSPRGTVFLTALIHARSPIAAHLPVPILKDSPGVMISIKPVDPDTQFFLITVKFRIGEEQKTVTQVVERVRVEWTDWTTANCRVGTEVIDSIRIKEFKEITETVVE